MNRLTTTIAMVSLLACGVLLSGCIGLHGPNDIRRSIARQNDVKLKQNFGISTNGMTLRLARGLANPFVDEPLPRLKGIRRAQFGDYEIVPIHGDCGDVMIRDLDLKGWERVVRVSSPKSGEEVCIYAKERNDKLRGLVAVIREDEELKIARVQGNLDRFLANVMDHEWFDDFEIGITNGKSKRDHSSAASEKPTRISMTESKNDRADSVE